jgi:hypothetical protein
MTMQQSPGIPGRFGILGFALVLLLGAGCAAQPRPLAAPVVVGPPPDLSFVIPFGTASAEMRGEAVFVMPDDLTVLTGQSIVIQNDDQAMHYFAEAPIAPGQTYRKVFGRPGAYGYGGVLSCSIAERKSVTVRVVDALDDGAATRSAPTAPR